MFYRTFIFVFESTPSLRFYTFDFQLFSFKFFSSLLKIAIPITIDAVSQNRGPEIAEQSIALLVIIFLPIFLISENILLYI